MVFIVFWFRGLEFIFHLLSDSVVVQYPILLLLNTLVSAVLLWFSNNGLLLKKLLLTLRYCTMVNYMKYLSHDNCIWYEILDLSKGTISNLDFIQINISVPGFFRHL